MSATLRARGYSVDDGLDGEPRAFSVATRAEDSSAAQQFYGSTRIACSFILDVKAKSSEVNAVLRTLRLDGFTHGIAVFQSLTAGGIRTAASDIDIRLELFSVGEVIINVLESSLYIPHIPLVRGSAEDSELRAHCAKLPVLRRTDSIARRLGLVPNQIILMRRSVLPRVAQLDPQLDAYRIVR
jgi:hypothetical protein